MFLASKLSLEVEQIKLEENLTKQLQPVTLTPTSPTPSQQRQEKEEVQLNKHHHHQSRENLNKKNKFHVDFYKV